MPASFRIGSSLPCENVSEAQDTGVGSKNNWGKSRVSSRNLPEGSGNPLAGFHGHPCPLQRQHDAAIVEEPQPVLRHRRPEQIAIDRPSRARNGPHQRRRDRPDVSAVPALRYARAHEPELVGSDDVPPPRHVPRSLPPSGLAARARAAGPQAPRRLPVRDPVEPPPLGNGGRCEGGEPRSSSARREPGTRRATTTTTRVAP